MQPTGLPIVFGAPYSVYVRAVRLALEEKGVRYEVVPVDIFSPDGAPSEHMARHPFGKIPAFEHAGFRLYESGAITRYVDEAFPGPRLQPEDPRGRARMNQIISILDGYAYRTLVWDIYVERVARQARGAASDEQRIAAALPKAEVCLSALSELMGESAWLAGPSISLADLHAAPMFALFRLAPEGAGLFGRCDTLLGWWDRVSARPSFLRTQVPPRDASVAEDASPGVAIRPFAEGDAAQVRELFITVNRLLSPTDLRGAFEAYIERALVEEIDRIPAYYGERDGGFWVVVTGEKVVGMFGLERVSNDAMELRRMYVHPAARRHGIARQMLQFAEDECARRGRSRLELSTAEIQHAAIALYKNAGYRLVREETAAAASNKSIGSGILRYYYEKIVR